MTSLVKYLFLPLAPILVFIPAGALASQETKTQTAPAPLRIRIYKSGDEKKPVWNISSDGVHFGTKQFGAWAMAQAKKYKTSVQGVSESDAKFPMTYVEQVAVIDAEPGAPFGYIQTVFEALGSALFYKLEYTHVTGQLKHWSPTLDELRKKPPRYIFDVLLYYEETAGVTRKVGSTACKDDEEVATAAGFLWNEMPKEKNIQNTVRIIIASAQVPWSVIVSTLRKLREKGITDIHFGLLPNTVTVPDQARAESGPVK
ncbi:MAG: hypothetical protein ACKVS6_10585 [Planctomycetota bacterium]